MKKKRHVVVAIPAYTGVVNTATMRCLIHDMTVLMSRGDGVSLIDDVGSAYIDDTRAALVDKFLASGADPLVMIDWDVTWDAGALVRLVDHPVDLVGGVYPRRNSDPTEYLVRYLPDQKELWAHPETGLLEVAGIPGGFMKCSRNMLEKMVAHYSDLQFAKESWVSGKLTGLFESYRYKHPSNPQLDRKLGDDYAFCQRWRDMGGRVWCDPEITMAHIGRHGLVGHFGKYLKQREKT